MDPRQAYIAALTELKTRVDGALITAQSDPDAKLYPKFLHYITPAYAATADALKLFLDTITPE